MADVADVVVVDCARVSMRSATIPVSEEKKEEEEEEEKMSMSAEVGTVLWPKPSMASGNEMKEPSLPSFMTMRGPAQTRSSRDGASFVMFMARAKCCAVHIVRLCQTLVLSSARGSTAAAASGADISTMIVPGKCSGSRSGSAFERCARLRRDSSGRELWNEEPVSGVRQTAGHAGVQKKGRVFTQKRPDAVSRMCASQSLQSYMMKGSQKAGRREETQGGKV
ncbi:hypothetical protein VTH06DRAFT_6018 [Thermothelomyces fergusii]